MYLNLTTLVITLNISGLNMPIKGRYSHNAFKKRTNYMVTKMPPNFKYEGTNKLKRNRKNKNKTTTKICEIQLKHCSEENL